MSDDFEESATDQLPTDSTEGTPDAQGVEATSPDVCLESSFEEGVEPAASADAPESAPESAAEPAPEPEPEPDTVLGSASASESVSEDEPACESGSAAKSAVEPSAESPIDDPQASGQTSAEGAAQPECQPQPDRGAAPGQQPPCQPPFQQPPYSQQPPYQPPYGQQPYAQQPYGYAQPPYGQPAPGRPPYGQPCPPPYGAAYPPPYGYGQQPYGQPPYSYCQPSYGQPSYGQPPYGLQPYAQPPYGQPVAGTPVYAAQPNQAPGATGQSPCPPQQPGAQQQPPTSEPSGKKRVWPWVLLVCVLLVALCCAGFAACVGYLGGLTDDLSIDELYDELYSDEVDDDDSGSGGSSISTTTTTYTYQQILAAFVYTYGAESGEAQDNVATAGVYVVGEDIEAGTYYLEGSQDGESYYYVFESAGNGSYAVDDSVVYIGNYLTELEDGDVIAFLPAEDDLKMYPIDEADTTVEAPYSSGLYRVGVDIPAGTYVITAVANASSFTDNECAAYVMSDLEFDDDSITATYYVIVGSSQTITVEEGDYLELYAAIATPVE